MKYLIKRFFDIDSIKRFYYRDDYNLKDILAYAIAVVSANELLNNVN